MVSVNVKLQLQAVIGEPYMRRESGVGFLMSQVVRDVGKKGPLGRQLLNQAQRVFHGGVRRMRAVAQGVKKQDVQIAQQGHGIFRYVAEVGEIGGAAGAISVNFSFAMQQPDRKKMRSKQNQFAIQRPQLYPRQRGVIRVRLKDVVERFPDLRRSE